MDIREELEQKLRERGAGDLSAAVDQELYHALLELAAQRLEQAPRIQGDKKLYYVSAEFLVGKLLSNNLINLGLYAPVKEALAQAGRSLAALEELEAEPSLGNGGLGRLLHGLHRHPGPARRRGGPAVPLRPVPPEILGL